MRRLLITVGLAVFSMFFGAGNLMYPIKVGQIAGSNIFFALSGFILGAIGLPLLGLIGILLFGGNYKEFFYRIGTIPGEISILFCMVIIGPLIAMPRIVTLSYTMLCPFMPAIPLYIFSIIFLTITFLLTYKENKIMALLGNIISPLLLISLAIIIIKSFLTPNPIPVTNFNPLSLFWEQLKYGYNTLDLFGAIFFSAILVASIKDSLGSKPDEKQLTKLGFKAGLIACGLLGIIYIGLSFLGLFHGQNIGNLNEGEVFSALSFRVLGHNGAIIISLAVLMACLSTIMALAAILAEYIQNTISKGKLSYTVSLIIGLLCTFATSNLGLSKILELSSKIIPIGYPIVLVTVLCNIAYKLFGFKYTKPVVFLTCLLLFLSFL